MKIAITVLSTLGYLAIGYVLMNVLIACTTTDPNWRRSFDLMDSEGKPGEGWWLVFIAWPITAPVVLISKICIWSRYRIHRRKRYQLGTGLARKLNPKIREWNK